MDYQNNIYPFSSADIPNYNIKLGLSIPYIEAKGKYEVGGNVLLFPVRSKGEFWAAFGDIAAIAQIYGKEVLKDGIRYMRIEKITADFHLKKSRFRIRDVINHGNIIGKSWEQMG